MRSFRALLATALWPALVRAYASTDSIQDADALQTGYLPNHNMDPNVVGSSSFGILWQQAMTNPKETWYAKPLVYTPSGKSEMVITASNTNTVRVHDSKSGTLLASRQLTAPFLQADIGCADIPNFIGVTGTPIIDPVTDTLYLFAKGYQNNAASGGLALGRYWMYALQLSTLADVAGFPVLIDGHHADNDATRYFVGGTVLQRPSLASLNGVIIAAFGGHCDLFNYTGYLVSVSKTPGVGVVSLFAMESSPGAPTPQALGLTTQNGGRAGIWQSGMGIAADPSRSSVYFVTGNGQGHANGNVPASGRLPMSTLDECIVRMGVSSTGVFSLTDYFQPYDYINMDAADMEIGSSGVCMLGPSFPGAPNTRLGVAVGKAGKVYVVNTDNLGGFKQGPGGSDNTVQTLTTTNSVFGGVGSYPLEGGYFYFTPVGDVTYAFKYSTDSKGAPFFTQAGVTPVKSTGRTGVGQPTITTLNGLAGTAILWITDVATGLNAFSAVPNQQGILQELNLPATPGLNKYQRPAFGNGRVFVTSGSRIIAMGAPVNLPLACSPNTLDFGQQQTGMSSTLNITCQANTAITQINGCTTASPYFQCSNSSLPVGAVAAGTNFTVPVTWNLTNSELTTLVNTSWATVIPGIEGTSLNLLTTNANAGYASMVPVSLRGTVVSTRPFVLLTPGQVDFGGVVLGSASAGQGLSSSMSIANLGNSTMTITGMAWQTGQYTTNGFDGTNTGKFQNVTFSGAKATSNATFGQGFSAVGLPQPGSTIAAGSSLAVPLYFNTNATGSFSLNLYVWTDGGVSNILFSASAGNPAIATIAVSTMEGGWDNSVPVAMAFGNVLAGSTVFRKIRICNTGGSVLSITKSKPPISPQLTATNPYGDLVEGQKIDVGACANGTVAVYAANLQPNQPAQVLDLAWVLNTDGQDALNPTQPFGVRNVDVSATIVSRQVGPLLSDGTARYQYVGCFVDNNGRNLATQVNNSTQEQTNTIEQCQGLCYSQGYAFSGVEYQVECWCGNKIALPGSYTNSSVTNYCTMACSGNSTEACGGSGGYEAIYADVTRFNISDFYQSLINGSVASGAANGGGGGGGGAAPANPATIGTQWNYLGCYQDNVNGRSLSNVQYANNSLTLESCAVVCKGYNFFGAEYGVQCYCGYTLNTTLVASAGDCSVPCGGNSSELCGAGNRLSVYNNAVYQTPPPSPSHVPRAGNYAWLGCYTEAKSARALGLGGVAGSQVTIEVCASYCNGLTSNGTALMGVEYGSQCYCGNVLGAGSVPVATSQCNMLCANNSLEFCGAGNRLDLYTFSPSTSSSTALMGSAGTAVSTSSTASPAGAFLNSTSSAPVPASPTSPFLSSTSTTLPSPTMNPAVVNKQWNYLGCFQDNVNGMRSLLNVQYSNNSLTLESCSVVCNGYNFFGTEYGSQCYCGYTLNTTSLRANEADCSVPCGGNPSEFCGAGNRLSVYNNTVYQAPPASPSHVPRAGNYAWLGCYTEATSTRALALGGTSGNQVTVEVCASVCNGLGNGTALMGVEYGSQCYCGNVLGVGSVQVATSQCNMLCANNSLEFCGAGNRLDLYTFSSTASTTASTTALVVSAGTTTPGRTASPTGAFVNSTSTSPGPTSPGPTAGSSSVSPLSSPLSSSLSPSTSASTSLPSPTMDPAVVNKQWTYLGCFQDNVNGMRTLPNVQYNNNTLTLESCSVVCQNYNFFGTEYGSQCYCGYTLNASLLANEGDCSAPCAGNAAEFCGAGNRLNVYNNTVYQAPPASPSHVPRAGNYSWLGCYTEATASRALGPGVTGNQVTVEVCASVCNGQANGTALMGVEYGSQCYCGNVLAAGSVQVPASQCNMLCANNSLEFCGAGNRLDLYTFLPAATSVSSAALVASTAIVTAGTLNSTTMTTPATASTMAASTITSNSSVASSRLSTANSGSVSSTVLAVSSTPSSVASAVSGTPLSSSSPVSSNSSSSSVLSTPVSSFSSSTASQVPSNSSLASSATPSSLSSTVLAVSSSPSSVAPNVSSSSSLASTASPSSLSSTVLAVSSSPSSSASQASRNSSVASSATPSSLSSTVLAVSSSSPSTQSASAGLATPSSVSGTSTTSSPSTAGVATTTGPKATATNGYYYVGCFAEPPRQRALPQVLSNNSMTPELCIAYANSVYSAATTATTRAPYLYLEYHNQCNMGANLNFYGGAVTSLVGPRACKDVCSGSVRTVTTNGKTTKSTATGGAFCGGRNQFNLYALSTPVALPTTGGPVATATV